MKKILMLILAISVSSLASSYLVHYFSVNDPRDETYGPCYTPLPSKAYSSYEDCTVAADSMNVANRKMNEGLASSFIDTRTICMEFEMMRYMRANQPSYCK